MPLPDPISERLMAYLDGEMAEGEAAEFQQLLAEHPEWQAEARELAEVVDISKSLHYRKPPPEVWDRYWDEIDARLTRRFGWILVALGGALLGTLGFIKVLLWTDNPWIRGGVVAVAVGVALLFVAVARGRLLEMPHDRYRKIRR